MSRALACAAAALLLAALVRSGPRGAARYLVPTAALCLGLPSGPVVMLTAFVCAGLWQHGVLLYLRRRRLQRLRTAAEEPIQAMFEQASLYGSAEHCALAALPACSAELRPIWQQALADWLRGGTSEEAFADVGQAYRIPLLVRLARALALSRHTGSPLDCHLGVLLEDAAEDRQAVAGIEGETLPYFVATALMASALFGMALVFAAEGRTAVAWLLVVALATGGVVPLVSAALLP